MDFFEFQSRMVYVVSSRTARNPERSSVSEKQKNVERKPRRSEVRDPPRMGSPRAHSSAMDPKYASAGLEGCSDVLQSKCLVFGF